MKRIYLLFYLILIASCKKEKTLYVPSDTQATTETRELYNSMQGMGGTGILFGHHDDTGYGVGWHYNQDSSDVKGVTGSFPAVYGWDLSKIEHGSQNDINGLPFSVQQKRVREAYARGGINTFCWHMDNPVNGQTAWDTAKNIVTQILPGGTFHDAYVQYLDYAAEQLNSLQGENGEHIPVLFRPFHELNGDWFWWGKNRCTPDQFKNLWRFTIDYLRKTKQLHNLLIVYSTSDFSSEADFLQRYPGDEYVDFMGFDSYCVKGVSAYQTNLDRELGMLDKIAAKHHKPACLAETGYLNIPQPDWWTNVLLPVISKHNPCYLLVWRNANDKQYYAPYPGQESAEDFKKFSESDRVIFQDKLTPMAVYGKATE